MSSYNGHVTRFSDSSLYDEVCVLCGATDGYDGGINNGCLVTKRDADKTELMVFQRWNQLQNNQEAAKAHKLEVADNLYCTQFSTAVGQYIVSKGTMNRMKSEVKS